MPRSVRFRGLDLAGFAWLIPGVVCLGLIALSAWAVETTPATAGHHAETSLYLVAIGGAFLAYLAGLWVLRARPRRLAAVLLIAVLSQVAPLARPLLLSQDAFVYWDYGRIAAVHGGNPYREPPSRFPADPGFLKVAPGWRGTTSVYGPLFTIASEGGALAVGGSPHAASLFYKSLAAAGSVLLAALAATLSRRPAFAAAAVGWNPLMTIHFAGGGHNDVWMMALLLGALVLEARGRRQLGGALWALAAGVKWIPLLLLPVRVADRRRDKRFGHLGFAAAAALTAGVASLLYGDAWLRAFAPLTHDLSVGSRASLVHVLRFTGASHGELTWLVAGAAGLGCVALLVSAHRARIRLGLTAGLLLLATPWILPWYVSWAIPLAAAEDDSVALGLSVLLSGYLLMANAPI